MTVHFAEFQRTLRDIPNSEDPMTQLNLYGRSLPHTSRNRLVFDRALEEAVTMGRLPQDASAVLNTIKEALREEPPESLKDREGRLLANGWEPDEEFPA